MKGYIASVKRMAVHDGDGIRTTVFMKGCPLRCRWCHNPETLSRAPQTAYYAKKCLNCGACSQYCQANIMINGRHVYMRDKCTSCGRCERLCPGEAFTYYGRETDTEELLPQLLEDRLFYENSGGGVTISGGEPLMQPEFTVELLKRLKAEGIRTAVDTCGYVSPHILESAMPYTDVFLYDVKAADSKVHESLTGRSNELILDNLRLLTENGATVEVRVPLIPGMNDGEMDAVAELLAPLPVKSVKLLAYHHFAASKYEALGMHYNMPESTVPPDEATMDKTVNCFRKKGVPAFH